MNNVQATPANSSLMKGTTNSGKNNAKVNHGKVFGKYSKQINATDAANKSIKKSPAEQKVDKYLTLISRLENQIKKGKLSDQDLEKILGALEKKILSLPKKKQASLQKIKEFQKMQIKELKELKEKMKTMLSEKKERDLVLHFLKSKDFIDLIRETPPHQPTYARQNMPETKSMATFSRNS